jgi:hypothetical protein
MVFIVRDRVFCVLAVFSSQTLQSLQGVRDKGVGFVGDWRRIFDF